MKNNIKKMILLVGLLITLHADDNKHYLGLGTSLTQAKTASVDSEYMSDISLKYGYKLIEHLNLEFRGSFYLFGGSELYHPSTFGLYLNPYYQINDTFNTYALLGYTRNTLSKQDIKQKYAVTIQDDFSYGVGLEYKLNSNIYGYVDYISQIDKEYNHDQDKYAMSISSFTLGAVYKFGIKENKSRFKTVVTNHKIYKKPVFVEFQVFDDFADMSLHKRNN